MGPVKLLIAALVGSSQAAAVSKPVLRGTPVFSNATLGVSYDEDMVQHQVCWCTRVRLAARIFVCPTYAGGWNVCSLSET